MEDIADLLYLHADALVVDGMDAYAEAETLTCQYC